jgi:hypothetical protein
MILTARSMMEGMHEREAERFRSVTHQVLRAQMRNELYTSSSEVQTFHATTHLTENGKERAVGPWPKSTEAKDVTHVVSFGAPLREATVHPYAIPFSSAVQQLVRMVSERTGVGSLNHLSVVLWPPSNFGSHIMLHQPGAFGPMVLWDLTQSMNRLGFVQKRNLLHPVHQSQVYAVEAQLRWVDQIREYRTQDTIVKTIEVRVEPTKPLVVDSALAALDFAIFRPEGLRQTDGQERALFLIFRNIPTRTTYTTTGWDENATEQLLSQLTQPAHRRHG